MDYTPTYYGRVHLTNKRTHKHFISWLLKEAEQLALTKTPPPMQKNRNKDCVPKLYKPRAKKGLSHDLSI